MSKLRLYHVVSWDSRYWPWQTLTVVRSDLYYSSFKVKGRWKHSCIFLPIATRFRIIYLTCDLPYHNYPELPSVSFHPILAAWQVQWCLIGNPWCHVNSFGRRWHSILDTTVHAVTLAWPKGVMPTTLLLLEGMLEAKSFRVCQGSFMVANSLRGNST